MHYGFVLTANGTYGEGDSKRQITRKAIEEEELEKDEEH